MATGTGTGTKVPPSIYSEAADLSAWPNRAVSLADYASLIHIDPCAFWGVYQDTLPNYACGAIWTEGERWEIALALAQAEAMIEDVVGYPLSPRWIVGRESEAENMDDRWVDIARASDVILARWSHVIEPGIKAETTIASGASVHLTSDPAVVGPLTTSATKADEIHVYYPGTDREIEPSSVTFAGGNVTIEIPKCRLVGTSYLDNSSDGILYSTPGIWQTTVDVKRIYNDPSTHAIISDEEAAINDVRSTTAQLTVMDGQIGRLWMFPAVYADGAWSRRRVSCPPGPYARLYYRAGIQRLDTVMKMAIIRLAHSLIPEQPCTCSVTAAYWKRDRNMPEVITRERAACPFGMSDGAWNAFNIARGRKTIRLGVLS